ncbi:MAG: hypothetical protein BV457_06410 [Thermoplasmata archaeon M9B1D]|nr:MAG: hypothetical protein BV457_06410 [Thermoplasmata archaeon M9B1D]PNX48218.1 MAG: hypothetical protein BV456_10050 [Thermoplasmata archaeon M8B2D]
MLVTYEDIEPYLNELSFDNYVSLCGISFYMSQGICKNCPFGDLRTCLLDYKYNKHLPQLVKQIKLKHPELFI